MGAFDISSGKKKVAPIQAEQGIAAPSASLASPAVIDARASLSRPAATPSQAGVQSITQGADGFMRAHQPGDATAISYPPVLPNATTTPSQV